MIATEDAYTIRIFVAEGDPEGIRIVDRANWTGVGLVVPRDRWSAARSRSEFEKPGVYILSGYETDEIGQERLVLYIGQTETLGARIDQHLPRDFWDRATVFVSGNDGLNRAHVTWLEWALVERAKAAAGARLENGPIGKEPKLSEWEKADVRAFLREILRILPLVGLRAFEPRTVIKPSIAPLVATPKGADAIDTIVVPAQTEGFERAFIGAQAWWAIRIAQSKLEKLKWIAAYRVSPISAITHIAEIDRIEPYGDTGKYKLFFKGPAVALDTPVPYGAAPSGVMQAARYTTRDKVLSAKSVLDINLT